MNKKCHLRKSQLSVNTGQRLSTFGLWRDRVGGGEHREVNYLKIYILFLLEYWVYKVFHYIRLVFRWLTFFIVPNTGKSKRFSQKKKKCNVKNNKRKKENDQNLLILGFPGEHELDKKEKRGVKCEFRWTFFLFAILLNVDKSSGGTTLKPRGSNEPLEFLIFFFFYIGEKKFI